MYISTSNKTDQKICMKFARDQYVDVKAIKLHIPICDTFTGIFYCLKVVPCAIFFYSFLLYIDNHVRGASWYVGRTKSASK